MKFLAIAFATLMLLVVTASAQDSIELNGDYMYTHLSFSGTSQNVNSQNINTGWDANINVPLFSSKNLGFLFDVSGAYGGSNLDNTNLYTYGGGFQYTFRNSQAFQPFANFTMGDATFHTQVSSINKLYFSPGGGLDVHVAGGLWVRGGVDYLHTGVGLPGVHGVGVNGVRVLGGLTYRF
ncbi:MAG: outer membrane beta-barrel protein [Terriglobales bacterium]